MFRNSVIAAAGLMLVAAAFFAGRGSSTRVPGVGRGRILYYPGPIHPAFGSIEPGLRGATQAPAEKHSSPASKADQAGMVKDPVCGMWLKRQDALKWTEIHHGWESHFCSEGCRKAFRQDPDHYIGDDEHEARKSLRDALRL
ncbi:MAG: YHS domain-containing protein [Acidobacteriia bacterium]|nr:YHS domain-containing protein [Terriglobia bacterium]